MPRPSFEREAIEAEIGRVRSLGVDALRALWRTTFRASPPPAFSKDLIALGDRSRADHPQRLKPGTVLLREYQGERHTVTVVAYASLSIIARAITGTAWNGPRFFGLRSDKETVSADAASTSPGAPNARHLAQDSGIKPRQAAVAQRPGGKSAAAKSPLQGGERRP